MEEKRSRRLQWEQYFGFSLYEYGSSRLFLDRNRGERSHMDLTGRRGTEERSI